MITVSPQKDKALVTRLFLENGLLVSDFSSAVVAKCGDEVLGFCLYDLDDKKITVHKISPEEDMMLADGILRSALHVAAERSVMDAYYSEYAPEELFEKLKFIKNPTEMSLDIDKLFGGCGCSK